jgi:hypothetical protein
LDLASHSPGLGAILDFDSALQMFLGIIAVTLYFLSEITFYFCSVHWLFCLLSHFCIFCICVCIRHPVMESVDRNLEQALTGLGLCPSPAGLAPARHNDLLEVPREFSGSSGSPGWSAVTVMVSPVIPKVQLARVQGISA